MPRLVSFEQCRLAGYANPVHRAGNAALRTRLEQCFRREAMRIEHTAEGNEKQEHREDEGCGHVEGERAHVAVHIQALEHTADVFQAKADADGKQ